jgi:hypothetical protein
VKVSAYGVTPTSAIAAVTWMLAVVCGRSASVCSCGGGDAAPV